MLQADIKRFSLERRGSGKRSCFQWRGNDLDAYINWAFSRNNLFYVSEENGISGIGVAYALPKPFDGNFENLLPYDELIDDEKSKEIIFMDWIASTTFARKSIVSQFKKRFSNWENQRIWGVHYGEPKIFSTNYINKIHNYQWEQD